MVTKKEVTKLEERINYLSNQIDIVGYLCLFFMFVAFVFGGLYALEFKVNNKLVNQLNESQVMFAESMSYLTIANEGWAESNEICTAYRDLTITCIDQLTEYKSKYGGVE